MEAFLIQFSKAIALKMENSYWEKVNSGYAAAGCAMRKSDSSTLLNDNLNKHCMHKVIDVPWFHIDDSAVRNVIHPRDSAIHHSGRGEVVEILFKRSHLASSELGSL